ncbi:MAG: gliding motility-associated C-terminal domain-containing protein [Parafilimonas sp.]|nr:gliding motility-associated C-terminal domain-containing protein [Parafilimonas sp.]
MLRIVLPALMMILVFCAKAQNACTALGQNPSTAFPVCGLDTFKQTSVPNCGGKNIPTPGCTDALYQDLNPFWYKFTCYQTGTLGFLIIPDDKGDDYDWQLFDITGRDPNAVYTDPSLIVAANWSAVYGNTGATVDGTSLVNCAGFGYPPFSSMPVIQQGHNYILLLSHFNTIKPGQAGYSLVFTGGTASIVDTVKPAFISATANCAGETIYLKFNKKLKCSSLAANGSDFSVAANNIKVIAATGINCSNSFDMDSAIITLNNPLPPGNYNVIMNVGSDNNTLLDACNNELPKNAAIPFTIFPLAPTPMDSITPVQCAPDVLRLVFRKRMRCSSVAANGSDFILSGNNIVASAFADSCSADGLSNIIKVKLTKPIQTAATITLTLQDGTDGNTLLDECAQETPAGSTINFVTADTVSAAFNYKLDLGCLLDTLFYNHDGRNAVNTWNWRFDVNGTSNSEDSFFTFNDYGTKHIKLFVSNGVCDDSSSTDILLDNQLISNMHVAPSSQLCPEDAATFADSSTGKIVSWFWIFGDGTTSTLQNPPAKYYPAPPTKQGSVFPAALIVKNDIGCYDTSRAAIKVFYNCYIAVPSAFTPNGDGLNDYLYPLNAYKADNLDFKVYNRWGQLVFETKDWTRKWDGRINGNPQAAGTYVWMLEYTHHDTGQHFSLKGTTVLIR